jgi:hypothetical protein
MLWAHVCRGARSSHRGGDQGPKSKSDRNLVCTCPPIEALAEG